MKECVARMTSKGQITVQKVVRDSIQAKKIEVEKLNLSPHERFEKLANRVEERFKKLGITRKDVEDAVKWAQE